MKRTLAVSFMALMVATLVIPIAAQAAQPAASAARFFGWAPEAQLQWAGTPRDVAERGAKMNVLNQQLMASRVPGAMARQVVVELDAAERQRIDRPGRSQGKYLVGIDKPLDLTVDLARWHGGTGRRRVTGRSGRRRRRPGVRR